MKKNLLCFLAMNIALYTFSQSCPPNIGFDAGNFTNWVCETGTQFETGCNLSDTNKVTTVVSGPIAQKHTIIPVNTLVDPFGGFLINPDLNNVARLGSVGAVTMANQVERISYTFTIPSVSTEFGLTYKFALVHNSVEPCHRAAPFFSARVYDVTEGKYIDCFTREYFSTVASHGFQFSTNTSQGIVMYKTWTPVSLNLSAYAGHTLKLEFTNSDCSTYGHWAYAYVDVENKNCGSAVSGNEFCPGSPANLIAPYGYQSYTWWNSNFTQNLGNSTTLNLSPAPVTPTVFAVDLVPLPGLGCRDTVYFTVKPKNIAPIPANAGPDAVLCSNGSAVAIGTSPVSGYSYSWSPSTGLNAPALAQTVAQPTTSTDYILTVTDIASGCTSKDTVAVNVVNAPSPAFSVNTHTQCISGNLFQYTLSSATAGSIYEWHFGDGTMSVLQNPPHTYASIGTFTVKVIVTNSSGCKDSAFQTVTVVPTVPAPTITNTGNVLASSASSGNQWYLNGNAIAGATGSTYTPTASGTYTVVVTLNGCASPVSNPINYSVTGIDVVAAEWKLRLAPNPVNDKLIISYSNNQKLDIEILDMTGRILFNSKQIPSTYKVDLTKFLSGAYLVRLVNSKTKQEVKQTIIKL